MSPFKEKSSLGLIMSIARPVLITLAVVAAVYVFGGVPIAKLQGRLTAGVLHAPEWEKLADASLALRVHLGVAIVALVIGAIQFAMPKGTRLHRATGGVWLLTMLIVAGSSFFLRNIHPGHFSPIHALSLLTLIAVPWIIYTASTGRITDHRNTVIGLYVGGLVTAGILAFLPGRVLWSLVFS